MDFLLCSCIYVKSILVANFDLEFIETLIIQVCLLGTMFLSRLYVLGLCTQREKRPFVRPSVGHQAENEGLKFSQICAVAAVTTNTKKIKLK